MMCIGMCMHGLKAIHNLQGDMAKIQLGQSQSQLLRLIWLGPNVGQDPQVATIHSDREAMTFLYRKDLYTGRQGPLGPGYSPVSTAVCQSWDGKATASHALPTVVAQDVTSYRTSGRWHMQLYVATYVMTQRYKSGCTLVPGSLFVSLADRSTLIPH